MTCRENCLSYLRSQRVDCEWFHHLLVLEVLWTAETLKLSIDHDGNSTTQCFTFFHTKRETAKR